MIICWFNNNTGVLDGIDVGRVGRTQLSSAEYRCIGDATAARRNVRRHVMDVADVIFAVFVHVVAVHATMHLMRVRQMLVDAIEAVQLEDMVGLSAHAIAVLVWRCVQNDAIRTRAIGVSCRRCRC